MPETVPPAEPSASADPRSVDGPAPTGPLRLDGAFARRDREDWERAAIASLGEGGALESLARTTLDELRIEVLHDESPVRGRLTPDVEASGEDRTTDNRLVVLGWNASDANAHALVGLAGGVTSLEFTVRKRPDATGASGSTSASRSSALEAPNPLALDDLDAALAGVHLDMITLSLRAGPDTGAALDALLALYTARGLDPRRQRAALDADPIGESLRSGDATDGLEARVENAMAELGESAVRAAAELPLARVCAVDMTRHHESGASPVQELVAGIATAARQLESLRAAGLSPDTAERAIAFRVSVEADIVGGVVKLRALERLWRHVLANAGLPVQAPFVIAETSRRQQSRLAPWVNHLRNVAGATAAMIGDADVIVVHPHDLVDGRRLGDEAIIADRVARNLPILLAEECGLGAVADAAGGAHAIESLTQATVAAAWTALGALQKAGGLVAAIADGHWQAALARTHAMRVDRLRDGTAVRVGVNRFRHADAPPLPETDASAASAPEGRLEPVREAAAFERIDDPERSS